MASATNGPSDEWPQRRMALRSHDLGVYPIIRGMSRYKLIDPFAVDSVSFGLIQSNIELNQVNKQLQTCVKVLAR